MKSSLSIQNQLMTNNDSSCFYFRLFLNFFYLFFFIQLYVKLEVNKLTELTPIINRNARLDHCSQCMHYNFENKLNCLDLKQT